MPIPMRMNPVPIELVLIAKQGRFTGKDKPAIDPVYRRPRGRKIYHGTNTAATLKINAQIVYDRQEDKVPTELGDSPITSGHITMRKRDYDALTNPIIKGDLVVKVDDHDIDPPYEVSQVLHGGYLRRKANLMLIYFERTLEFTGSP